MRIIPEQRQESRDAGEPKQNSKITHMNLVRNPDEITKYNVPQRYPERNVNKSSEMRNDEAISV